MKPALALIVLGGLIIIAAVAAGTITRERDKERVAEFYRHHSSGSSLPSELRTSTSSAEAVGFVAGIAMVLAGIWLSRKPVVTPGVTTGSAPDSKG